MIGKGFQIDTQEMGGKYDMIIGSTIVEEMEINFFNGKHCIKQDSVHVPGELSDKLWKGVQITCILIYLITYGLATMKDSGHSLYKGQHIWYVEWSIYYKI